MNKHSVDAVLKFNALMDGLILEIKNRPNCKKALRKASFEYLSRFRAYRIPIEDLDSLILSFKEKGLSLMLENNLKEHLQETANLRQKILNRTYSPSPLELRKCLFQPYAEAIRGKYYYLKSASAKELATLLPKMKSAKERKDYVQRLTLPQLAELLFFGHLHGIKIWLSKEVRSALLALRSDLQFPAESIIPDYFLGVTRPDFCLFLDPSGSPYLWTKVQSAPREIRQQLNIESDQTFNQFQDLEQGRIFNLYFLELQIFEKLLLEKEFIRTERFQKYLLAFKARSTKLNYRNQFNNLSDFNLKIRNQSLSAKLYPHQRVAVAWLLENQEAFIADDMGLGKTLSVLAAFQEWKDSKVADLLLVVCPNSLVMNWQNEVKQWIPELIVQAIGDQRSQRRSLLKKIEEKILNPNVLIINYEAIRLADINQIIQKISANRRVVFCLDESQRVKNSASVTFKALSKIAPLASRRILLSGTPTPKDFSDLWAQQYLLDLGSSFGSNYFNWLLEVAELGSKWSRFTIKDYRPAVVHDYQLRFQERMLRRSKNEVLDLPAKIFSRRDLKLTGEQLKKYQQITQELLVQLQGMDGEYYQRQLDNVLEQFLRAVQIASNPRILDANWKGEPVKFLELDQIVEEITNQNRKVVVWTNFKHNVLELCQRYQQYQALPYYGDLSLSQRQANLDSFQNQKDKAQILVAIPAAGGVGLNLTAASAAVYLDKTWNAEHWLQSIDRIYRIGQKERVNIISLQACSIDYLISQNLKKKQELLKDLLTGDMPLPSSEPSLEELVMALQSRVDCSN